MAWKTIHRKSDGQFLKVYDAGTEGQPGYRGEDASDWNFTHTSEVCDHVVIADRPDEDHNWDDGLRQWMEDIEAIRNRHDQKLEREAREAHFQASSQKAELAIAKSSIAGKLTKATIEAVTL